MKVFFLSASIPLTKTYERLPDKTLRKSPYPNVLNFTSIEEDCKDIKHFADLLTKHANLGHCLLKGIIKEPLINQSRAGSTTTLDDTEWLCLDVDGLAGITTVDQLMDELGLSGISYVVQYSASYLVENDTLRCHIFLLIDKRIAAPILKQWLMHMNLTVPALYNGLKLTRTGNTLHWPLDVSTCQNDKLIYIAPPSFKGMKDPMPAHRIKFVRKAKSKASISSFIPNTAAIKEAASKRVTELRAAAGLPKRKETYRSVGTIEYMVKPDQATITEMKTERGFVYFNLNGGDSWGYFHPEGHPEFIHNFKDEPLYKTSELLPEYWKELEENRQKTNAATSHQGAQQTTQGTIRLAFCDMRSSVYYRGFYDPTNDNLELHAAKNEKQLRDFAKQHGMPLGDFIPEWNYTFDPQLATRVDVQNKVINTFQPTEYMNRVPKPVTSIPKTIYKIISHVLCHEEESIEHFINWVATILQTRNRTRTAWVFQGTTGTGKGVLMNKILRPIFGYQHTTIRRMEELNEQYNHFMQSTFIVFVDEVQTKALNNEKGVMAKLKNFITEPTITIRRMYANAIEVPNYTNWIFASNKPDPVAIDKEDRRFNVGKYQPMSIDLTNTNIDQIPKELQAFHDYLMAYPVDTKKASTPLDTQDREQLISISESSAEGVADALRSGNFEFFMDHLPTGDRIQKAEQQIRIDDYKAALVSILDRTQRNRNCAIARDELYAIFEYLVGGMSPSPNKFTAYLRHQRIHMDKVWGGTKTVNGIRVTWADTKKFQEYRDQLAPPIAPQKAKVIKMKASS